MLKFVILCLSMVCVALILIVGFVSPSGEKLIQNKIIKQFAFDGSHRKTVNKVKKMIVFAESFEHINTSYSSNKNEIFIRMEFSSKTYFHIILFSTSISIYTIEGEFKSIKILN